MTFHYLEGLYDVILKHRMNTRNPKTAEIKYENGNEVLSGTLSEAVGHIHSYTQK